MFPHPFLYVPGLVSADLGLQIFKVSMNGVDGGSAGLGSIDHCLYSITSGLMLFPSCIFRPCPIGDYGLGTLSITCPV